MIQEFQIRLVKLHDVDNVKLPLCDKCLYMKSSTVLFMLELECIKHVYCELCQYINSVNEKFKYFVTYLRQNYINNKYDVINILHKIYEFKNSYIEYELIVYAVDNIVYNALHETK